MTGTPAEDQVEKANPNTLVPIEQKGGEDRSAFDTTMHTFFIDIESISDTALQTLITTRETAKAIATSFQKFMEDAKGEELSADGKPSYKIKPENLNELVKHAKSLATSALALTKTPRIFFCALVHQYDAYLGALLKAMFNAVPEMLNGSEKQFSFSELTAFGTLEAARDRLVEREIESIIRDSHSAHFDWLEKKLGISLRKGLSIWPTFIEITERRNLFVHTDGRVSSQYLKVCGSHGAKVSAKLGDELNVSKEYFQRAVDCILEISLKLGQVLWRKVMPSDSEQADNSLHSITFELLRSDRFGLANTMLLFAVETLKKYGNEVTRRINAINLAIAQRALGQTVESKNTINGLDWSACTDKFKLAVAVLNDKYAEAAQLMEAIGASGEVSRASYCSWPLFRDFRKSEGFLSTYRKLFGEDFVVPKPTESRPHNAGQ